MRTIKTYSIRAPFDNALSLSLSAKNGLFFFLGGASVIIAHFILPDAAPPNKKA